MIIRSLEEVEHLKNTILVHTECASKQIRSKVESLPALEFFAELKFDKSGFDPLKGTELNFIEQLNQTFSDLVVLESVEALLRTYSDKEFKLNMGPSNGFDIESIDGEIVAECFAVTTATSNQKLKKDCLKLMEKAPDKKKYVFFYSRSDAEGKLQRIFEKYPEITFNRIREFKL